MTNKEKLEVVLKNYSYFFTVQSYYSFTFLVVPMEIDFDNYTEITLGNPHYSNFSLYDILHLANKNISTRQIFNLITNKKEYVKQNRMSQRVAVLSNNFTQLFETRRIITAPINDYIFLYDIKHDIIRIYQIFKQLEELIKDNYIYIKNIDNKGIHFEINKEEENKNMNNIVLDNLTPYSSTETCVIGDGNTKNKNFEFGPIGNQLGLSVNGIAFRNNEGNYVTYNTETNTITDVTNLTFNVNGMLWSVPVTIDQIKANDIILHKGDFVVATANYDKEKGNSIDVVNPITQTKQTILPTQNIFGFNFITKVVNCAKDIIPTNEPNAENPFGNMIPLMMFSKIMNGNNNNDNIMKMMALQSLMKNNGEEGAAASLPFAQVMPWLFMKEVLN